MAESGEMSRKERVTRAIEFTGPDHMPGEIRMRTEEDWEGDVVSAAFSFLPQQDSWKELPNGDTQYTTEWGFVIRKRPNFVGYHVDYCPLEDWESLKSYQFPDPEPAIESLTSSFQKQMSGVKDHYVLFDFTAGPFLILHFLRRDENFLMDLALEQERIGELFDRVLDYQIEIMRRLPALGVDAVIFFDDWGHQGGMLFSPQAWENVFIPRYERLRKETRELGLHFGFQATGDFRAVLPDLVELGIDILVPYQHSSLGIEELGQQVGGKICCRCSIDYQTTGPEGTPEQAREEVRRLFKALASEKGGLIYRKMGVGGFKIENAEAGWETFLECRDELASR